VRILIVGLGSIGRRHLRIVRQLVPQAVVAVLRQKGCDGVPAECDYCFSNLAEALTFQPRVAAVASPATFHLDTAIPLATAGVHLLVEKPLAADNAPAAELVELCEQRGVTLLTGYNLRFTPALQRFRSLLAGGAIGRILSIRAEVGHYLPAWRANIDYRDSVSSRRSLGGGALLELSHEIDYLRWIFGEVAWVQAVIRRQSSMDIDVEDTVHLLLGIASRHEARSEAVASLSLDLIRHDATRVCTAIGDAGTLRWTHSSGVVEYFPAGGSAWEEVVRAPAHRDASYAAEWEHFLACVQSGSAPVVSGRDGLAALAIIAAARRAAESARQVSVDYDAP
jgi:predicted dehydrogenase